MLVVDREAAMSKNLDFLPMASISWVKKALFYLLSERSRLSIGFTAL
jgi:hypothetical protein